MMDTSISPYAVIAKVRGIGVAVIARISGFIPISRSVARCCTPKRCCSSITAKPRFLNAMSGWIKAWVPIKISISPFSKSSKIWRRAAALVEPVSNSTRTFSGSKKLPIVFACCCAKISVGAIKVACIPAVIAAYIAKAATTVLPEPTSPWSKRFMWIGRFISRTISFTTRFCASVNSNGSVAIKAFSSSLLNAIARPRLSRSIDLITCRRIWKTKNSSNDALRRASVATWPSVGACMPNTVSWWFMSLYRVRKLLGTISVRSNSPYLPKAWIIKSLIVFALISFDDG